MDKMLIYKDCPDDDELAMFIEGKLSGDRLLFIKGHLNLCTLCNESVMISIELSALNDAPEIGNQDEDHSQTGTQTEVNILTGAAISGTIIDIIAHESYHLPMVAANNLSDIARIEDHNHSKTETLNVKNMETTIYQAPNQFGEESNNYVSPNVDQGYSDTCAVRSQQLVLNDFGIPLTQEDLIKEATEHGWYTQGEGTPLEFVGNLLENHGVEVNRFENANIYNLTNELAQGHKVIIGVDANELWSNGFLQGMKDVVVGETANHALIVAGIDTSDPNHVQVILEDPGTGDVAKSYPLEQFMDAWKDSHYYMVSTQEPAPLAFNQETMMGFDYDKGHIENAETLLSSIEDTHIIPEHSPIYHDHDLLHPVNESIYAEHDPFHPGNDPIHVEHDPHHPDSEIDDHHPDNDHHDDLDILHFDNNI
jgi:hypothetical protein